jgi:hypothetical protein
VGTWLGGSLFAWLLSNVLLDLIVAPVIIKIVMGGRKRREQTIEMAEKKKDESINSFS